MIPLQYLGEILVDLNYISQDQLKHVLDEQKQLQNEDKYLLLGELLIEKELITRSQLQEALRESLHTILKDPNANAIIKETAAFTLENLEADIQNTKPKSRLTEEGTRALLVRLEELKATLDELKQRIHQKKDTKPTKFQVINIQNQKNQLIELEQKIAMIQRDLERFGLRALVDP